MRLAQLRHQMLIAMGLPACWTSPGSQSAAPAKPNAGESPVYTAAPKRTVEIAMFDGKSCLTDQIVETVCGRGTGEYCGATAKSVELAINMDGLYVTTPDDARFRAMDFILDDSTSEAYVTRLQNMNERLEGKPACCYSRCTPLVVGAAKPLPSPLPAYHMRNEACIPAPLKGTASPDVNNAACPQGVEIQGELRPYSSTRNDQCCYVSMQKRVIIQKGRPARVDGDPKFAALAPGSTWHAELALDVIPDDVLAANWLAAARMEHASVAAFSATSLRLMALGAPPALIAATHRAALDEIEHARIAFAIASAYAGAPVSPAAFPDVRATPMTLRELALETFVDGCVGETIAAVDAEREADVQPDPTIARVLRQIAIDEARHAELAWQIVAWCVRQDASILDELYVEPSPAHADVIREVIAPCVAALAA